MARGKHDWTTLDPRIDSLKGQGWTNTQVAKELNIGRQTLVDHLRSRELVHLGTPKTTEVIEVPQETPGHPGTLEGYQEVIEEIQQSVPEVAHLVTDEGHPSVPEVHPEAFGGTLAGIPGHTQEKTYVFDVRHIALIERYAQDHRLALKDVIYAMCQEFFEHRGYVEERRQQP